MILLDSCVLLWLPLGTEKLPGGVLQAIRSTPRGQRWVCPLSAYEIAIKAKRGKLGLPLPASTWFTRVCEERGLTPLPLTAEVCLAAAELPDIHRDPVDRLIVAQALQHGLRILTSDRTIPRYPGVEVLWS